MFANFARASLIPLISSVHSATVLLAQFEAGVKWLFLKTNEGISFFFKFCYVKSWTKTFLFSTKKLHGLYGSNLRHAVGCNFLSFKVETVGQGVVVVLVEDEESHSNGTSIGIYAVIQQICVVVVISRRDGPVKRQKDQLS